MTTTAKESSPHVSQTESYQTHPYSAISEHSSVKGTPTAIRDWLMSLPQVSPASRLALQDSVRANRTSETCGLKPSMSFAEYDHDSRTWRTYQVCLLTLTPDEYTETWPKAGMTVDGVGYLLPKQELRIVAIDGGVWPTPVKMFPTPYGLSANQGQGDGEFGKAIRTWPTPDTQNHRDGRKLRKAAKGTHAVHLWPTPNAHEARLGYQDRSTGKKGAQESLTTDVMHSEGRAPGERWTGGQLNPMWVEWLMGWPHGWTDLKPLEMDKYQQWCEQHGIY